MGGATSLYLVGNRPEPVAAALVLVDIVPLICAQGASKIRAFMNSHANGFATVEEAANVVAAYNPHRPSPTDTSGLMRNLRRRVNGRLYWHWDPRVINGPDGIEPPFEVDQLRNAANRVRIPTLLVRGKKSDVVTDEGVADIKNRIPNIEVFDVEGAGHMVAGDKNDAFIQGAFKFLQRQLKP
jgi:pimeloyl-ACP methyl ester carboxylesterase